MFSLVLVVALAVSACAPQAAIVRGALQGAKSFVLDQKALGNIKSDDAELIIKDLDDGVQVAIDLDRDLKLIPGNDPQRKQKQFGEVRVAVRDWQAIYARGHFGLHPKVAEVAGYANSAMIAIEVYYAVRAGDRPAPALRTGGASRSKSERELKQDMDNALKSLKKAAKQLK